MSKTRRVRCIVCKKLMLPTDNCAMAKTELAHHKDKECCDVIVAWENIDRVVLVDD